MSCIAIRGLIYRLPLLLSAGVALVPALASGATVVVYPGPGVISHAISQSAPFDTILVSPGLYPHETGEIVSHPLTLIGVGGAEMNEVRICSALCEGALIIVVSNWPDGAVTMEGLTLTPKDRPSFAEGINVFGGTSPVVVRNCVFRELQSGVQVSGANNITVMKNLFVELNAGIYMGGSYGTRTIVGNTITRTNFGISLGSGASGTINANLLLNNLYGVHCDAPVPPPTFLCNDIWKNGTGYGNCSDPTGHDGNIAADPLVCDPDSGDFRLLPGSPCLPENSPVGCGLIGAFGPCEVTALEGAPAARVSLTVEPNPIVTAGEFSFVSDVESAALEIYDLQGRLVQMLIPEDRRAVWVPDASVPRGVYFARLRGAADPEVVKFAIVR